jgi:hypothetical protein
MKSIIQYIINLFLSFFNSLSVNGKQKVESDFRDIQVQKKLTPLLTAFDIITSHPKGDQKQVNIIGFRDDSKPDAWNDKFIITVNNDLIQVIGTTDPGTYYTDSKSLHEDGEFHLLEGYWRRMWQPGLHRGQYEALVHRGTEVEGWRGSNKNKLYIKTEHINHHHGDDRIKNVGTMSAGCQVQLHKGIFFDIIKNIKQTGQKSFDYFLTLMKNYPVDKFGKLKSGKWYYH